MRMICLPLQPLFSEEYINFLRNVQQPNMREQFLEAGYDYPEMMPNYHGRPVIEAHVRMVCNIIAFYDMKHDVYFVTKNRYTGQLGWFDQEEMKTLVAKDIE